MHCFDRGRPSGSTAPLVDYQKFSRKLVFHVRIALIRVVDQPVQVGGVEVTAEHELGVAGAYAQEEVLRAFDGLSAKRVEGALIARRGGDSSGGDSLKQLLRLLPHAEYTHVRHRFSLSEVGTAEGGVVLPLEIEEDMKQRPGNAAVGVVS